MAKPEVARFQPSDVRALAAIVGQSRTSSLTLIPSALSCSEVTTADLNMYW